jgi:hypothetical protein
MSKYRIVKRKSTRLSAARIKEIILANYEPGRQDKCKKAVYRNIISKQTGISERTFWRYMQEIEEGQAVEDKRQLKLWE